MKKMIFYERVKMWLLTFSIALFGSLGAFLLRNIWAMHDDIIIIKEKVLTHEKDIQDMKEKLSYKSNIKKTIK